MNMKLREGLWTEVSFGSTGISGVIDAAVYMRSLREREGREGMELGKALRCSRSSESLRRTSRSSRRKVMSLRHERQGKRLLQEERGGHQC